ncbi:hypothetical protein VCHA41O245_20279 [Vibrio chagasii]|nr:hypothetical protein VCHA41O245_20279 [Vibrio chagasii]
MPNSLRSNMAHIHSQLKAALYAFEEIIQYEQGSIQKLR